MQPTVINKIVSMFIAGGLVLLGVYYVLLSNGYTIIFPDKLKDSLGSGGQGFLAVVGGLLLLPLAALAGAVCEGLTDIFMRRLVKWIAERPAWIHFLSQGRAQESYKFWLDELKAALHKSDWLKTFSAEKNFHGIAVGLLYDSEREESIDWGASHYSTYILVTNFAFLAVAAQLYIIWQKIEGLGWCVFAWSTVGMLVVFYSCLSFSLHRYLYSYEIAFRQSVITLLREQRKPTNPSLEQERSLSVPKSEMSGV